jgi:hypothetical protein
VIKRSSHSGSPLHPADGIAEQVPDEMILPPELLGLSYWSGPRRRDHWCRAASWKRRRSDLLKSSNYKCLRLLRLWVCGQPARVVQAQRHIHSLCSERAAGLIGSPAGAVMRILRRSLSGD